MKVTTVLLGFVVNGFQNWKVKWWLNVDTLQHSKSEIQRTVHRDIFL